jgi:hypothetical protein
LAESPPLCLCGDYQVCRWAHDHWGHDLSICHSLMFPGGGWAIASRRCMLRLHVNLVRHLPCPAPYGDMDQSISPPSPRCWHLVEWRGSQELRIRNMVRKPKKSPKRSGRAALRGAGMTILSSNQRAGRFVYFETSVRQTVSASSRFANPQRIEAMRPQGSMVRAPTLGETWSGRAVEPPARLFSAPSTQCRSPGGEPEGNRGVDPSPGPPEALPRRPTPVPAPTSSPVSPGDDEEEDRRRDGALGDTFVSSLTLSTGFCELRGVRLTTTCARSTFACGRVTGHI